MTKPFNIEPRDINLLNDVQLTHLLKALLHAEASKFGIAQRAVEVALNIRVGDEGEDGRISWNDGPDSTDFIPNRLSMFQNKASEMSTGQYANEILTTATKDNPARLKPKVDQVLDRGGTYIVFTTQELNKKQKEPRIEAIREKLKEHGKEYHANCEILIYGAAEIAGWVNHYVSTIVAVQDWLGKPTERGLKTYDLWSEHEDLSRLPFVHVESRRGLSSDLSSELLTPRFCSRIMGLSGLGKTRTAFQMFSDSEYLRDLVTYIDASLVPRVDALVADWVSLEQSAILVVDNCEYRLHERLAKEVRRDGSKISLLSLDYNFDTISAPTVCFELKQMKDEELLQLLEPLYGEALPDLDRIVGFAQGFPQMAVLLAEARLNEDPRIGELSDDELANKLLWKRDEAENPTHLNILQACSLFDMFGIEGEAEPQLEYISIVTGIEIDKIYECIQKYSKRGLIDRRGRFGQLVPKPLAIRLAGQWWEKSREQKQKDLIAGIPENMIEGFCSQIEKMDFHPEVKSLTEELCGTKGPFGQAEVILSTKGSRLFRSFVTVNPEVTSSTLYRTLDNLTNQQLLCIDGDTRRNLIWGLEKLCYHSPLFAESAWSLMLLASAENESWSNNATGMFAQLFRVNLSGTEAEPGARLEVLQRALQQEKTEVDLVVISALEEIIRTYGGSRTVGAEYQGTKAPLEEWRPKIWQEIFDYWNEAFELLFYILPRGKKQKKKVLSVVGNSIRGFVSQGRIEMLDSVISRIVGVNGRYWPEALTGIKQVFQYDSEGLREEAVTALNKWLELLSPDSASLEEQLQIIVIDPPWEHHKNADGKYVDLAIDRAIELAIEMGGNVDQLFPSVSLLLKGEQKQSYIFGQQLSKELADVGQLVELSFNHLLKEEFPNANFLLGIFHGIYERSPKEWHDRIDDLLKSNHLSVYYPDFIRTGCIENKHLDVLLNLLANNIIPLNSIRVLSYGSCTDHLEAEIIINFCLSLLELEINASWVALDIIHMYWFTNKNRCRENDKSFKKLVTSVSLSEKGRIGPTGSYQWHSIAEYFIDEGDEEFASQLMDQIIDSSNEGFDHSDLWHYIKPILSKIVINNSETLWPKITGSIINAKGIELYWLQQLYSNENSDTIQLPSIFNLLPTEVVISWCRDFAEQGPPFVARCVGIVDAKNEVKNPTELLVALLENFGDDEKVTSALDSNMFTRSWSGSLVPHLVSDKALLRQLEGIGGEGANKWVNTKEAQLDKQIELETIRDEERNFGIY